MCLGRTHLPVSLLIQITLSRAFVLEIGWFGVAQQLDRRIPGNALDEMPLAIANSKFTVPCSNPAFFVYIPNGRADIWMKVWAASVPHERERGENPPDCHGCN